MRRPGAGTSPPSRNTAAAAGEARRLASRNCAMVTLVAPAAPTSTGSVGFCTPFETRSVFAWYPVKSALYGTPVRFCARSRTFTTVTL